VANHGRRGRFLEILALCLGPTCAQAVHHITTTVSFTDTASILISEVVGPGRPHGGEYFAYD
jgi:hypothetical protein